MNKDTLREAIASTFYSSHDDAPVIHKERQIDRITNTVLGAMLAPTPPPLTPDASTTGKDIPSILQIPPACRNRPSQGAEGRTPRTAAAIEGAYDQYGLLFDAVPAHFARQLETELASARAELAEAKAINESVHMERVLEQKRANHAEAQLATALQRIEELTKP